MDSGFTDSISARYNDGGISDSLPCKRRDPCWESLQITIQQLSARDSGCCWSPWVGQHFLSYVRQQETLTQQHMIKPNESSFLQNMMSGIFRNANYGVFIYLKNIHKKPNHKNQDWRFRSFLLFYFYFTKGCTIVAHFPHPRNLRLFIRGWQPHRKKGWLTFSLIVGIYWF